MPASNLPRKLVHKILLHAARTSTSTCRTLCQVSIWVRHLALPLLYTIIPIRAIRSITAERPIYPPTPTFNPAWAVRGIWAPDAYFNSSHWRDITQHCTRMSHLTVNHENFMRLAYVMAGLRYTDARAEVGDLHMLIFQNRYGLLFLRNPKNKNQVNPVMNTGFVRRITHLCLEDPIEPGIDILLGSMSWLTHLALLCGDANKHEWTRLLSVATDDTSVEAFVLMLSPSYATKDKCREGENWVYEMRDAGKDVVYVVRLLCDDLEEEWNSEVRGGETIWERAVKHTQELMDRMDSRASLIMPVDLPPELLYKIFLYVAESSTSSGCTLCKVSTWVRHLALPFLYTTVSVDHTSLKRFYNSIASGHATCPPIPTFHPAMPRFIPATIPKCSNPEVHQGQRRRRQTRANEGREDLQILLLDNSMGGDWSMCLIFQTAGHPLFERITHLRLEDPITLGMDALWDTTETQLKHMPRLTHFAVPGRKPLRWIFRGCSALWKIHQLRCLYWY
ncbi:hypothetical protein BD779DRAFT_1475755 [Infundibulicybe gibba]|nr:hypothetical protein BD779DRAFT_1475755 [Infundibulicybe gibba]